MPAKELIDKARNKIKEARNSAHDSTAERNAVAEARNLLFQALQQHETEEELFQIDALQVRLRILNARRRRF